MRGKNKFLLFILSFPLLVWPMLLALRSADAAATGTVQATVTAKIFSVSLDNGDGIQYLAVEQNSTQDTTSNGVNDSTTATNDGSVNAKFNIKSTNSVGGAGWTLGATAGDEQYTMKFCVTTCDTSPSWNSVGIHPSYQTLAASVAPLGTQVFDLQVGTPVTTTETTQQQITVTIQATTP